LRGRVMSGISIEGFFLGIDVGTQGTKTVLCDGETGRVIGEARASYPLVEKADGTREQEPKDWVEAVNSTVREVLQTTGVDRSRVYAAGVSGQQHGFVPLADDGEVIRPAKLWNDTSTERQCGILTERLGGKERVLELTGNSILAGYTLPKVLWLRENEPEHYARLDTILLPHNYINFYLTGEKVMEAGDSSGTAFFDARSRSWSETVLRAVDQDRDLTKCLPPLIESWKPAGKIRKQVLKKLGLPEDSTVLVSSGGGDNMMAAIGTGNTKKGVVTVSLGTSGTIYAYSDFPVVDPRGEFAAFCDSTGGWLPLACTMNVTVATELVKRLFSLSNEELESLVRRAPVGAGGLVLVPYFVGERTPNVPSGTGVFFGINEFTLKQEHLARAAMEGVTLGLRYGLESMREEGINPTDIRLTGGGSKSESWRQIAADIFNAQTVTMEIEEAASFGGALQAMWCYARDRGEKVSMADLTDRFVKLRDGEVQNPREEEVKRYDQLFTLQNEVSSALRKAFDAHRRIVSSD
jgi:xylulokinase